MDITTLLEIYIFLIIICIGLNFGLIIYQKNYIANIKKRRLYWATRINEILLSKNCKLSDHDIKKLKNTTWAIAFIEEYMYIKKIEPKLFKIIKNNKQAFINIFISNKSNSYKAFFADLFSKLDIKKDKEFIELMVKNLDTKSIYCRENTLKALYSFGCEETIVNVYRELSKHNIKHNHYLLQQGIEEFSGSKRKLMNLLIENYDVLIDCYKIATINSLNNLKIYKYNKLLIEKMSKENETITTHIIDLISMKQNKNIEKILINFLESENTTFATHAALGLTYAENIENIKMPLFEALSSPNYNVRNNAAKTLVNLNITKKEINKKINDKYGREIFIHNFDLIKGVKND